MKCKGTARTLLNQAVALLICVTMCGCGASESVSDSGAESSVVVASTVSSVVDYTAEESEPDTDADTADTAEAAETAETAEVSPAAAPKSYSEEQLEAFDTAIEQVFSDYYGVGMSVAVFEGGRVFHTYNTGYADKENKLAADGNTVYRSASVSKLVSSVVLMTLYDKGLLSPESSLQKLTGLPYNNPAVGGDVKLWHLMTHTAGLIDGKTYDEGASKYYTTEYVLEHSYNGYAPGEIYCYSNFGAGTMGSIAEILTGEYFHDYADEALFEPLGMNAAYLADLLEDRTVCANLYTNGELKYSPKTWFRTSPYYESFGLGNSYLTAQCELLISAEDLARIGILLSGDGSVDGVRIISPEAVNEINTNRYSTEEFDIGLNVRIYENTVVDGRTIYGHPGQALGAVCGLYYDPTDGTGIAILTNGCYLGCAENSVYKILNDSIVAAYDILFDEEEQ